MSQQRPFFIDSLLNFDEASSCKYVTSWKDFGNINFFQNMMMTGDENDTNCNY